MEGRKGGICCGMKDSASSRHPECPPTGSGLGEVPSSPHSCTPEGTGSGPSHGDFQPGHTSLQLGSCWRGPGSAAAPRRLWESILALQ